MRLSLQLFTVREALEANRIETLSAIRSFGLEYVELAGYAGATADQFRIELGEAGLIVSGAHTMLDALESDLDAVIAENVAFGNRWVIVPYVGEADRVWPALAARLNLIGEQLASSGLRLAYHNHDFEFGADGGFRQLVARTNPAFVWFQVDVGWVRYAGEDPAALLRELGERVKLVHLKDLRAGDDPHVLAGEGDVDWDSVLMECAGVEFGAIEMDVPPNDPLADVRACVEFFRARGLG